MENDWLGCFWEGLASVLAQHDILHKTMTTAKALLQVT